MPCGAAKVAFTRVRINVGKLNCHKPRSSYVTSILITKPTFAMFLLKLSTLSAAIFLFVPFSCGRSTGVFHYCFFFQYSLSDVDIRALFIVR